MLQYARQIALCRFEEWKRLRASTPSPPRRTRQLEGARHGASKYTTLNNIHANNINTRASKLPRTRIGHLALSTDLESLYSYHPGTPYGTTDCDPGGTLTSPWQLVSSMYV